MKIEKVSETTPIQAQVLNEQSNSTKDTYCCDYINNVGEEVYSTEEQVIGKWIDNKPIYRKVLQFSMGTGRANLVHNCSIDKLIRVSGTTFTGTDTVPSPFPHIQVQADAGYNIYYSQNKDTFVMQSSWTIRESYIIIEYTKTTD